MCYAGRGYIYIYNNYDIYQTNDLINYKLKAMTTPRKGHTIKYTHSHTQTHITVDSDRDGEMINFKQFDR